MRHNTPHIPISHLLRMLAVITILLYLPGCVAVPEQEVVAIGTRDREIDRHSASCAAGLKDGLKAGHLGGINPASFSVISWNSHRSSHDDWHQDLVSLGRGADIILLQEAALARVLKPLPEVVASHWLMATAFHLDDQEIGILSAALVSPEAYCVSREPEPLFKIPKIGLAARFPLQGTERSLLVVNIHLVNFTLGLKALQRQILPLETIIRSHPGPVILAGDFNTWSDERESLVERKMADLQMSSVSFDPDKRVRFFNHPVDGIYYRGLEVVESLTYQVDSSDHNPLEVHFKMNGESSGS